MKTTSTNRSYSAMRRLTTFLERYEYLSLKSNVGTPTFGFDRYINQQLYRSRQWRRVRDEVIIRDNGCDLGFEGRELNGLIIVHHINPILVEDIEFADDKVFDLENLICVSSQTHLAIHFGDSSLLPQLPIERYPGDTIPWKINRSIKSHG